MADPLAAMGRVQTLWAPRASQIARSEIAKFIASVGGSVVDYRSFHAWSSSDLDGFWGAFWDYAKVIGDRGPCAVKRHKTGDITRTVFFPEGRINIAENILRADRNHIAVRYAAHGDSAEELTIGDLRKETARIAAGLSKFGVGAGDPVASILPNGSERLIAYLACQALGAVWVQLPDDMANGDVHRSLRRTRAKLLFAAAEDRRWKKVSADPALQDTGAVPAAIVLTGDDLKPDDTGPLYSWQMFGEPSRPLSFQRIPFNCPAVLLLAGSQNDPEIIAHSAGGTMITHLKEHLLHGDLKPGNTVICNSDCDPRLWLWQISALACGATLVFPGTDAGAQSEWLLADEFEATHLVAEPTGFCAMRKSNFYPGERHNLQGLRVLYVTGEIADEALFDWVYQHIADDVVLCPMAGDSRMMAHYFLGSPLHPVRRGEFSALALGMALYAVDRHGKPVVARSGRLVCCEAFPTMPGSRDAKTDEFGSLPVAVGRLAKITCYGSAILYPDEPSATAQRETSNKEHARGTDDQPPIASVAGGR